MGEKLRGALLSVDWNQNAKDLCSNSIATKRIQDCNLRIAAWSRQLEIIEKGNPAISFIREMQYGGHNVASCLALALYKPAAASMRAVVECALYYTYFRSHPSELASLVRDSDYYVTKRDVMNFYQKHVANYQRRQMTLSYGDRLESWYSETSAVVHGQIPGFWTNGHGVTSTLYNEGLLEMAVSHFEKASHLVQDTFICVLGESIWAFVESDAKAFFVKGMAGDKKTALGLDVA